jgi:diguanylate cyclase
MTKHPLIEETHGYLRMALPMMSKYNIPITPKNYDVWYQYVSGKNAELKEIIDAILKKDEIFTTEINEALYRKYCMTTNEGDLKRLKNDLSEMLTTVLGELSSMTGKTEKYNTVLAESVVKLTEDVSLDDIRLVLSEILDETKIVSGYSLEIQQKLKKNTRELENLQRELEQTKKEAALDFLTGVANRKAFDEHINLLIRNAAKEEKPLSLLLIDIDHFKEINETHGHLVGDEVLKFIAVKIKEYVRGRDFIARYGGEEFSVLLPLTPLNGAKILAENICQFFDQANLRVLSQSKKIGQVTLSIGVAKYNRGEALKDFIDRADRALFHAKNSGGNRVATELNL